MLKGYFQRKILTPVVKMLKQGISPEKIALSIAWGVMLGIFPVLGTTTILCTVAAGMLRLNLPIIQLANWLVYPLQIILLVPFLVAGGYLFGNEPFMQDAGELIVLFKSNWFDAFYLLWEVLLQAVLVWLILAPVVILLIYRVLKSLLRRLPAHRFPMDSKQ